MQSCFLWGSFFFSHISIFGDLAWNSSGMNRIHCLCNKFDMLVKLLTFRHNLQAQIPQTSLPFEQDWLHLCECNTKPYNKETIHGFTYKLQCTIYVHFHFSGNQKKSNAHNSVYKYLYNKLHYNKTKSLNAFIAWTKLRKHNTHGPQCSPE